MLPPWANFTILCANQAALCIKNTKTISDNPENVSGWRHKASSIGYLFIVENGYVSLMYEILGIAFPTYLAIEYS